MVADMLTGDFELRILNWMSYGMVASGIAATIPLSTGIPAPYGRYSSSSWGPSVNARLAWFIQELPAVALPLVLLYFTKTDALHLTNKLLVSAFVVHYIHRSLVFPWLIRGGKPSPVLTLSLAFVFCTFNGFLQTRYLLEHASYPESWVTSPKFIIGMIFFVSGMLINIHSDHILRNLRKPGETGYKIPKGGMFDYVSGANFFGEILEWSGFAIASWSLPAAAFAAFTIGNIGPRAVTHHRWYVSKFDDYPKSRRALIPFVF